MTPSQRARLTRLLHAEMDATEMLAAAARVAEDPAARRLYTRLRDAEAKIVADLQREEARGDAEDFVAQAIDV
jgi:hypothetical protein